MMQNMSRRKAFQVAGAFGWTAVGLTAMTGEALGAEEKKAPDYWRAWTITVGKVTRLTVEGIYSQGNPGLVLVVEDADPQGINPKILLLTVKKVMLPGIWPAILQPVPAGYVKAPYKKGQYESVDVKYPDGSIIKIDKIIDADP